VQRLRLQLRRELGDIVRRLRDPRLGFVTVMDVEVSSEDLGHATLFVSVLGETEEQEKAVAALNSALGFIRRELARRLTIRHVPELSVRYDDTSERAARVSSLIDRLPSSGGAAEAPPARG
jgi:ribosome-binding factor A